MSVLSSVVTRVAGGPATPGFHLPDSPTDAEKYSYFGVQRRWPFIWLFISQCCLIYAFAAVMLRTLDTAIGLVFLTVMVPPVVVNLWLRMRRRRIDLEEHVLTVETWRQHTPHVPSVDIFLPSCGEDSTVLTNTFRHVAAITWDGDLTVYVLDDADNADTRRLAEEFGFDYSVRANRGEWKKAGNLIAGFERSNGELIAVFDADFAPRPDFLWETVPYLADPRTGVVQTAQYFDVDERVNYFARYAGVLQELFFRWIQPARDTYEAAICAGTNVVYRREAVVAAGGFAKVPLGEDVHSGVKLWVARYRTRYVPLVVAKGLAPDTWKALTNQQYRWCRSSMLLMRSEMFTEAPFSNRQRMCFWAAFLYYLSSAALPLTSALPTLLIVWMFPDSIEPHDYLLIIPAVLATVFVFPVIARGWRPTMARVSTVNSFCHLLAVTDAVRNRVAAWVPTGAASVASARWSVPTRVATVMRVWVVASQSLLWWGLWRHLSGGGNPWLVWPTAMLAVVQLVMLLPVLVHLGPQGDVYPSDAASDADVRDREPIDLRSRSVAGLAVGGASA